MNRRESVMLAHNYDPFKHNVIGWYMSQKLDGVRCLWDGGITRGLPCRDVPWANIEKHGRFKYEPIATGLWTRYFQPIMAPKWFLDKLPLFPLDGELYLGVGKFQETISIIKRIEPDERWNGIRYCVFDLPSMANVVYPGKINVPHFNKTLEPEIIEWVCQRPGFAGKRPHVYQYDETYQALTEVQGLEVVPQKKILQSSDVVDELNRVCMAGGEGLMLRNPVSHWNPMRSWDLLKVKKLLDSEGIVIGFTSGRETDRGSKLRGMIGAVIVRWGSIVFELSGFDDREREFERKEMADLARMKPGSEMPEWFEGRIIKRGQRISFRYRELTVDGKPKEARYWRH